MDYKDVGQVHRELAEVIKDPLFKLILIPRGHLKSSYITIGYTMQSLIKNPNLRVLIANATWENSRKFLKEIKGKVITKAFTELYGRWNTDHWNADEITIATRTRVYKEPSISTTGVEKVITGQHYDLIIADDLVSKENITTPDQVKKIIEYYESLIPILEVGGEIIVIGTRWHYQDLYGHIISKVKDQFRIWKKQVEYDGVYIFPEKFNDREMGIIRANMRPSMVSSQYYNEPIAEEDQVFKPDYFRYYEIGKEPKFANVLTTVDLARSEKYTSDDTAIVTCVWTPENDVYIISAEAGKWGTKEKIDRIYEEFKNYSPQHIGIEKDAAQKYFLDILTMEEHQGRDRLPIVEISSGNKAKEDRIMNLEPLYRAGKVYHPAFKDGDKWVKNSDVERFETQLMSFTPSGAMGKDDLIDAMASQIKMYGPEQIESKELTWAEKNKDKKKDLNFIYNAVLWDTEAYNKQQAEEKELDSEWEFLKGIEG